MTKESVKDILASGGDITWKKLFLCDLRNHGVPRGTKKCFQLESRYGDYETTYNSAHLYSDLDAAADRFMLIYNLVEAGALK